MERYTDTISGEELYVDVSTSGKVNTSGKYYYKDRGMTIRHRLDGPAIEHAGGYKVWWVNGKVHRLDGPAVEYTDGSKAWWVDGVFIMITKPSGKIIDRMK